MQSKSEIMNRLFKENGLLNEDVFKHQHFTIITRAGIQKIQANNNISITYDVIECSKNYCVVKAIATSKDQSIETFGSALKGDTYKEGNTNSWYVMEIAEKRALSRSILTICGLYQLGIFGEDESDSFKKSKN
tara:strand:+ start:10897 stop:11295 length:399 start_codon:yes stop_codon:yes gene_type:complete